MTSERKKKSEKSSTCNRARKKIDQTNITKAMKKNGNIIIKYRFIVPNEPKFKILVQVCIATKVKTIIFMVYEFSHPPS